MADNTDNNKELIEAYRRALDGLTIKAVVDSVEEVLRMRVGQYSDNDRIGITLKDESGSPYGKLTTNVPDAELKVNEVALDCNNLPEEVIAAVLETGYFKETGRTVQPKGGFVAYPVCELVLPN